MPCVVPSQLTLQPRALHLARDREAGDHMAAGAGGHDDEVARRHARPPRISCRFSTSTRSTIASATRFITIAEPP